MHEDSTEEEEMKRQRRMKIMKDITKKIRSRGRMDAQNRWWVAELLAADCEKAWLHPGEEETMQKWGAWLETMKKEEEKRKMEDMHQQRVNQMIKSAEGSAGLLHKITEPATWKGGAHILKTEEKMTQGFWTAVKQQGKNEYSIGNVMKTYRIWRKKP